MTSSETPKTLLFLIQEREMCAFSVVITKGLFFMIGILYIFYLRSCKMIIVYVLNLFFGLDYFLKKIYFLTNFWYLSELEKYLILFNNFVVSLFR